MKVCSKVIPLDTQLKKKTSFLFLKPWELREPRLLVVCVLHVHSDSAGPLQTLVLIPNHYFKIIPNAW